MSARRPTLLGLDGVELLLGGKQTLSHQYLDGIRSFIQEEWQLLFLGSSKIPEDIIRGVHSSGRPAHPHANPQVVLCSQGLGNIPQAVMPALSAADLQLDRIEGNINF